MKINVGERVTIIGGERAGRVGIVIAESTYGPEQVSVELTPGEFYLENTSNLRTWAGMLSAEKQSVLDNLESAYGQMTNAARTLSSNGYENEAGDLRELASKIWYRRSLIQENL